VGRVRKFPDHPLWAEIDKLVAEGKPVPSYMKQKVQRDPNKPKLSRVRPISKKKRRRELKRAGKALERFEEKERRKQIARNPKTYRPVKKVAKVCEHPPNKLVLVSHITSATTGDFKGWYRCGVCKQMLKIEKKVTVNA
jgi:hypothetical protein